MLRRVALVPLLVGALLVASATPASAHGGGHEEFPIDVLPVIWLSAGLLLLTAVGLVWWWPSSRLARKAGGTPLPDGTQRLVRSLAPVARVIGLASFTVVLVAALWGSRLRVLNIAPLAVFVGFWVGLQLVSSLVGDLYRMLNPYETVLRITHRYAGWPRTRTQASNPGQLTAAVLLLSFVWLASAYHDVGAPRALGVWLVAYSTLVVAGAAIWGLRWLRTGTGFGAFFSLLATMAPLTSAAGKLRRRPLLSGLSALRVRRGTAALVMVALGGTIFDSVAATELWAEVRGTRVGWSLTAVDTFGLVWLVALTWLVYLVGVRISAHLMDAAPRELHDELLGATVPLVIGFTVAHYLPVFILDGRDLLSLASDPLGRGWDLFGTRNVIYRDDLVSLTLLAWGQIAGLLLAQVAAAVVIHDRILMRVDRTSVLRVAAPMLVTVLVFTTFGLLLLAD